MKLLITAFLLMGSTSFATAESYGKDYVAVSSAKCQNNLGENLSLDLPRQELAGLLRDSAGLKNLSINDIKKDNPDAKVELTKNFYETGLDVLGGVVMGEETFGTYMIVLDKPLLSPNQEMRILFLEAMTGRQVETTMNCLFQ